MDSSSDSKPEDPSTIACKTVPTDLLWNNFLDKIRDVKILSSFRVFSVLKEKEKHCHSTTSTYPPAALWRFHFKEVQGVGLF